MVNEDQVGDAIERHATNLELFLDLVFVFAVAQVATVLGKGTGIDFGRGLLIAWLVWWLWSQFTWLGTAIDLEGRAVTQFLVLAAVPLALLMAVAIPNAYGSSGLEFAGAYLAVNFWALAIQGRGLWSEPSTRRAWLQYVPLAAAAPCLLMIGAFFEPGPRTVIWSAVAAFDIGSALVAARRRSSGESQWKIDPLHFVERHSLFVIISLGEVLFAAGLAASEANLEVSVALGLLATVSLACVCWWIYFAYVPRVIEDRLRASDAQDRGRVARDMLSFGHFPLIFGIVVISVVGHRIVTHPGQELDTFYLFALATAITSFIGGFLDLQWQAARHLAPERVIVIVVVIAVCAIAGSHVPGAGLVAAVAVLLATAQAITLRRFTRLDGAAPGTKD